DMVKSSDIYLLLLGEEYGDPMPDTGLAPTAEEWAIARNLGLPIVTFRQSGTTPDAAQAAFIAEVETYASGVFRGSFDGLPDLLSKVGAALAAAALLLQPLRPRPLVGPVEVPWRAAAPAFGAEGTILATYVLPVTSADRVRISDASDVQRLLARAGRDAGLFDEGEALGFPAGEASITAQASGLHRPAAGISVGLSHAVTVWAALPRQTLGTVYDEAGVAARIARDLRLAAALPYLTRGDLAIAVSLDGTDMLGEPAGPNSMTFPFLGRGGTSVRLEPQEAVGADSVARAAPEIGTELAARLTRRLRGA
ncbi:MAG: hypothetical protein ACYDAN_12130, partial [Candidatus Limnocylindrales bacterium]